MPHTHKAGKNITTDDDAVHHMRRLQLWDGCNGFIGHELLAGGADRFVEMEIARRECIESQGKGLHLMKKQLELHMGWVKDIEISKIKQTHVNDEDRFFLFSIGGN